MYIVNAPELVAAVSSLRLKHDTSTPYRSTANSIAERSQSVLSRKVRAHYLNNRVLQFNGGRMLPDVSVTV